MPAISGLLNDIWHQATLVEPQTPRCTCFCSFSIDYSCYLCVPDDPVPYSNVCHMEGYLQHIFSYTSVPTDGWEMGCDVCSHCLSPWYWRRFMMYTTTDLVEMFGTFEGSLLIYCQKLYFIVKLQSFLWKDSVRWSAKDGAWLFFPRFAGKICLEMTAATKEAWNFFIIIIIVFALWFSSDHENQWNS